MRRSLSADIAEPNKHTRGHRFREEIAATVASNLIDMRQQNSSLDKAKLVIIDNDSDHSSENQGAIFHAYLGNDICYRD